MFARTCSGLKATTHQATFRQFVTVVQLPANFQAISKQLVAYNTCTLTLCPNTIVAGLRKTSPEALGSLRSVSALLVLDILCRPIVKKRLYLILPLLNPVFIQAAIPFYTFSKSSGLG